MVELHWEGFASAASVTCFFFSFSNCQFSSVENQDLAFIFSKLAPRAIQYISHNVCLSVCCLSVACPLGVNFFGEGWGHLDKMVLP